MSMAICVKNTLWIVLSSATALLLLVYASEAVAAQPANSAGLLDNVLSKYQQAGQRWQSFMLNAATYIFFSLATISIVVSFSMLAMRSGDIRSIFAELIRFIMFTGVFFWLLRQGPAIASAIIDSLAQLGARASGQSGKITPSSIVDIGFDITFRALDNLSFWSPTHSIAGIIMALILLVIVTMIGVNMLLLIASSWILAYAGIFFLGFGGSRWTSDIAINYYKTVLGFAAQIMIMVLLIGVGQSFLGEYYRGNEAGIVLKDLTVLIVAAIVLLVLVSKVPPMIAGIITGASVGGGGIGSVVGAGSVVNATSTAYSAGKMALSASVGGAKTTVGGAKAVMAAVSQARKDVAHQSKGGSNDSSRHVSSGATSNPSTPYSVASGMNRQPDSGQSGFSRFVSGAQTASRVAAGATKHLAKGAVAIASEKIDRETTGGKIAKAIKDNKVK